MTRRHRTGWIIGAVTAAVIAVLAGFFYLRGRAAPEVARLLPEGDTILYFDLKPVRLVTNLQNNKVEHDPEYEEFVRQTGFQFERDLDEGAFAMHAAPGSSQNSEQDSSRYSEVFAGRFNSERVQAYLRKLSTSTERYRGHEIYGISHEDRIVRVTILSPDMVAASNTGEAGTIHHIVDQYEKSALPFGGPSLVRRYYHEVPFGSLAWIISSTPLQDESRLLRSSVSQLFSQFMGGGVIVASMRYTIAIQLRADSFVSSEDKAKEVAERLQSVLNLYRNFDKATQPTGAGDPDLKAALDSINIEQHHDRVSVTASLPRDLVTKIFEAPVEPNATQEQTMPTNQGTSKKHRKLRRHRR